MHNHYYIQKYSTHKYNESNLNSNSMIVSSVWCVVNLLYFGLETL